MSGLRTTRVTLAFIVLAGMAFMCASLAPPYVQNWHLQKFLNGVAEDPANLNKPPDVVGALVVDRAALLGIPLHLGDVTVERRDAGFHIRALYVVRVDLPLYTVDLHFRPEAGGA